MTLHTFRLRVPRRAPAEPTHVSQDRSLAYVLWLLLFLVFAPMMGVHVAFALFPGLAEAQTFQDKGRLQAKHG